ncbi:KilA-N domain-containing protein [Salmonella enterica]|uniref:KilA, N- domain-containing protein n=2 Tax=Salmonella enterica TaxID=28901 RepID=A0A379QHC9_SALER|nr:KilA-N domain-containing protein [Salmonella enterica]ECC1658242.1 KilA-N domain-containing protein [Salmonella enterica subsp. salamae]ASG87567.1 DNA-binding protein [Salmonella enterica subsp. salamae serovar 55:k:z39 str. 1315K]ECD9416497.1 KilA-N domain-containing protein [Salmonella enterica subsp. salamae]ECF5933306.1 KilA-N domain-containing protein [Salmonella enterica subsp. salamae]ECG1252020.1 KilA-N domain-containing protein [Salmonella enterica subsp. salamae]
MTTQIIISDISIHQDAEGRYSLNDLHKASGNERRHEPSLWLNLQQTKELIEEILNTGNPVFNPAVTRRGRAGGTYVCKELVYSYAMWISAVFSLRVIRAYDALVTQNPQNNAIPATSTSPHCYEIITSFCDGQMISRRMIQPGEILIHRDDHIEMMARSGYLVIHCSELGKMGAPELARRIETTRRMMDLWAK